MLDEKQLLIPFHIGSWDVGSFNIWLVHLLS